MVALLFWEPRRYRVMAVKLAVLATSLALLGVVAEGAWVIAARVLAAVRGSEAVFGEVWAVLFAGAGRGVLFVVLIGLLGFGVANLLRNTGGALGVGFVYFVIIENVVGALRPAWQEWLVTSNAVALLAPGGNTIYINQESVDAQGGFRSAATEVVVSNLHGGLVLAAVTTVVVTAGVVLFARRDLD